MHRVEPLQFVTVPILDARLHEVRAEIRVLDAKVEASINELKADLGTKLAEVEARLVRWVFLVMLGNVALSLAANTLISALKHG